MPCDSIATLTGGTLIAKGIVKEDALYDGVGPHIPAVPVLQKQIKTQQVLQNMQKKGITGVGTMEDLQDVEEVLAILPLQELMRVCVMLLDAPSDDVLHRCKQLKQQLNIVGFKAFIDGSLGSRTAKMYADWNDTDGNGLWAGLAAKETLHAWAKEVERVGFAPVMHAIGDAAVGKALSVLQELGDNTFARIEHAQCIAKKDLTIISGKMFGVQPLHQPADAAIALQALGSKRASQLHNWRRMLDAGARLSFGSDWPVAEADPIAAMRVAISCGLTVEEALFASTREAANSLQMANSGFLHVGANGDVVVLDSNPFETDWSLTEPSVTMTILAGKIVFE
jgi:predicted amidohydrolase YtcJ